MRSEVKKKKQEKKPVYKKEIQVQLYLLITHYVFSIVAVKNLFLCVEGRESGG